MIGPDLGVLFCGINPGVLSGRLGQHFARPGNRFWKVLHGAGFTDRLLRPDEQSELLRYGIGVTNMVPRVTAAASELTASELRAGGQDLAAKVDRWRPVWVAFVGVLAYRTAFARPAARIGEQEDRLAGSGIWVLPNPSGLQARYQLPEMIEMYRRLREAAFQP